MNSKEKKLPVINIEWCKGCGGLRGILSTKMPWLWMIWKKLNLHIQKNVMAAECVSFDALILQLNLSKVFDP